MDCVYVNKSRCCGCNSCASICPERAIRMEFDDEGFLYPVINDAHCVDCDLCRKVCPYTEPEKAKTPHFKCYAAYHKDNAVLEKSSSGGIFVALSDLVLNEGGVIYGADQTPELKTVHIRAISSSERDGLCGSKYVQSEIGICFIEVRNDLKNGFKVLFTGTPCQIAGLLSFLDGDDIENLLTAAIICHGVPSPKLFCEYIDYSNRKRNASIVEYHHRPKHKYWAHIERSKFVYDNGDSDSDSDSVLSQAWKQLFYSNAPLRPCCYECHWASGGHTSDITIGDFWGIEDVMPDFYNKMGVSAVLINTDKGKNAFELIKQNLVTRDSKFESITYKNPNLLAPSTPAVNREAFWKLYMNRGFDALIWKYGYINYYWQSRRFIKSILKEVGLWP